MTRLREHDGMTLPEVLTALTIAAIVSIATFALISTVMARSGEVSARVDSTQRARAAMDFITRQLRSQVCVLSTSPATVDARAVVAATPTSVTFFGDLSDESHRTGNTLKSPELRSITLESGKLVERRWTGVKGGTTNNPTYSYAGYPATPTQKRVLADDISTVDSTSVGAQPLGVPLLRVQRGDAAGSDARDRQPRGGHGRQERR